MSNRRQHNTYRTDGSLALRPASPCDGFRVLEGGRVRRDATRATARETHAPLSVAFVVAAIVMLLAGGSMVRDHLHERHIAQLVSQASYRTITVHSGATLWQIAEDNPLEGCSTTEQIATIRELNHLSSANLQVGMTLQVPVHA